MFRNPMPQPPNVPPPGPTGAGVAGAGDASSGGNVKKGWGDELPAGPQRRHNPTDQRNLDNFNPLAGSEKELLQAYNSEWVMQTYETSRWQTSPVGTMPTCPSTSTAPT